MSIKSLFCEQREDRNLAIFHGYGDKVAKW